MMTIIHSQPVSCLQVYEGCCAYYKYFQQIIQTFEETDSLHDALHVAVDGTTDFVRLFGRQKFKFASYDPLTR